MSRTLLQINASARSTGSVTRTLTDAVVHSLNADDVVTRDLAQSALPQITEDWVGANFTREDARNDMQKETLALSDTLVAELETADTIVIGVPIYNFGIPAALKAWVDLIARAGRTFRYTENGPEGLLTNKRAIVVVASGGTATESEIDFATPYLRHVLGFVGIVDVTLVAADRLEGDDLTAKSAAAGTQVAALAA